MTVKKKQQRQPGDIDTLMQCLDYLEDLVPVNEDVNTEVIYEAQDLIKQIKDARSQASDLQEIIDKQREQIAEQFDEISELENTVDPFTNRLAALTDRANWDGNTWKPVLRTMAGDVVDFIKNGRAPLH